MTEALTLYGQKTSFNTYSKNEKPEKIEKNGKIKEITTEHLESTRSSQNEMKKNENIQEVDTIEIEVTYAHLLSSFDKLKIV